VNTIWMDLLGAEVRYRGKYRTRTIEYGEGAPLVLMHGVGGHAEAYARNLKRLGESHRAISIDLLWHGLSGKPPFTVEMIPEYCKQVIDLLDDLGVEKASIEGESLGGWVGMWFALHYPDRIDKLILNTTAGIRKRLEWLMATPDRVTEELIDLRYALYNRPDTNASLTDVFRNSFQRPHSPWSIPESDLANIKAPTLVLWSDKNPGAGPDAGERIAKLIPGSQYYCITDAAHWPQWEQPEQHDTAVNAFLAGKTLVTS